MSENRLLVKGATPPDSLHGINLAAEAEQVIETVQRERGNLFVLYGQPKSGKSELIRRWVLLRLAGKESVWYGDCSRGLPEEFTCGGDKYLPDWKLLPAGIYFLDAFERVFALDPHIKRDSMKAINAAIQQGQGNVSIALVLRENSLRELFFLAEMAPDVVNHAFRLPIPSFEDALGRLSAGDPEFSYGRELLAAISDDLRSFKDNGNLVLAELLHPRLANIARADRTVEQYREAGGLRGLLDEVLNDKLDELRNEVAPEAVPAGEAILKEVSQKDGGRTAPNIQEISSRLAIKETLVKSAYEWLEGPQGLLRPTASGGVEIEPPQLAQSLREQASRHKEGVTAAEMIVEEGVESWRTVGTVLPKKGFEEVDRVRQEVKLDQDAAALMVHCALLHKNDEEDPDLSGARYWLGRIPDGHEQIASLTRALAAPEPEIRRKAALLLRGWQQAGVAAQLYRVALADPQPEVRSEAVSSLKHLSVVPGEVREALEEAAVNPQSPYRTNAVECLQIFPDEQTAAVLCKMSADDDKDIRFAAIKTLAKVQTTDSVAALVDIGLTEEDQEKRRHAAAALGEIKSVELQRTILRRIRQKPDDPREEPHQRDSGISLSRTWVSALSIALGNMLFPGLALCCMGRYWTGVTFLAANAALCVLAVVAGFDLPGKLVAVLGAWVVVMVVNQVVTFQEAIKDRRHPRKLSRMRAALSFSVFASNALTSFLLFHGLAHILLKRPRRGLTLMAAQALGMMPTLIFLFYEHLFVTTAWRTWQILTSVTLATYLVLTILIVCGSYWEDVRVGYRIFRRLGESRYDFLLERVLGGTNTKLPEKNSAVSALLSLLHSNDKGERRWAQDKLLSLAEVLPANELLEHLASEKAPAPKHLLRALRKNKRAHRDGEFLKKIEEKYATGESALRRHLVWILAGNPSQISLESLRKLTRKEGITGSMRYYCSSLRYRWGLAPKPIVAIGALFAVLLPLEILLLIDGIYTTQHDEWPLVRLMWRGAPQTSALNSMLTRWQPWHIRIEEKTAAHARALAAVYPDPAARELAELFRALNKTPERWLQLRPAVADSLGMVATKAADPKPAVQALVDGSGSQNHIVKEAAIIGLDSAVRGADPALVQRMASLLADPTGKGSAFDLLLRIAHGPRDPQLKRGVETARVKAFEALSTYADLATLRQALCSDRDPKSKNIILLAIQWKGEREAVDILSNLALASPQSLSCGNHAIAEDTSQFKPGENSSMAFERLQALAVNSLGTINTEEARRAMRRIQDESPSEHLKKEAQAALNRPASEALYLEGAELYINHDYGIAAKIAQKSIAVDPRFKQSSSLLRAIFVDQERYQEAETLFNDLIKRYPSAVPPRMELVFLEHEYLGAHDTGAYKNAYMLTQSSLNLATAAQREEIVAALAECSLTTGRYKQAITLAHEAGRDLQDPGYKVSMSTIAYAAAVAQGDYAEAQQELTRLQKAVSRYALYKTVWVYDGTLNYLTTADIPSDIQGPLLTLIREINQFNRVGLNLKDLDRRLFDENRAALKAARWKAEHR